jgi:hypothetical protein
VAGVGRELVFQILLGLTLVLFGVALGRLPVACWWADSSLDFELVPTTLVVESIGSVVLAVTTALVHRRQRPA